MWGSLCLKRYWLVLASLSVFLFLACAPDAHGQTMTTGDIVGTVTDSSGAVVPTAKVTIKMVETNEMHSAVSNAQGQYRFSLLQPGEYEVTGDSAGLKSKTERFTLLVGQETSINLKLEVKGTQEVIEVQAQADILQAENANLATGFDTTQFAALPMNGGDITTIGSTVPGAVRGNYYGSGSTLYTLNGSDDMDPFNNANNSGASNNTLGANEVAEASVVLNAYSADYGRMSGAQINFVGKTGTNTYHGNLFHNYNDKIFNANDFFNNQKSLQEPRSDSHNFGGSIGGPLKKNKLFFYFNYESLQYALPKSGTLDIPSPQMQQYALATVDAAALPLYKDAFALWNGASAASKAIAVTNGNGPLQDGNGHLGCGTKTFWNAGIQAPGGGVFGTTVACSYVIGENTSQVNTESLITGRLDFNITDKQKISARYNYDWGLQATSASLINPAFNSQSWQPQDQGQLTYTYAITPTLINNFIGSALWYQAIFGVANFAQTTALMPESISVGDAGWTSLGAGVPTGRDVGQAQIVDDLTWVKGKHAFKFGINYRYDQITDSSIASSSQKGSYSFADLTDFTTGAVNATGKGDSFSQSFPQILAAHIRMRSADYYAQDEWKIRRNLTLTLGFRAEHDANPVCLDKCFARLNIPFGAPGYTGGANVPYNQSITTGLSQEYHSLQSVIPEPRFGFAWSIDSKTVVRGGIGLFASLFSGSTAENVFGNAPNKYSPSVTFGEVGLPSDPASSAYAAIAGYNIFNSQFYAGGTLTQIKAALGKISFAAPSYYSPPQNYIVPKTLEWSMQLERTLGTHDVLAVSYVGNHPFDTALTNGWVNGFLLLGSNGLNQYYGTSFAGLPTSAPDPRFLTVSSIQNNGYSNYDAMTVQLRHSLKWGFQGQINWTWSHALSLSLANPYNLHFGYGNAGSDVRHGVNTDLIWVDPFHFKNGLEKAVLGGWTLGMKMFIYTGTPFSSSDPNIPAQINSGGGFSGSFMATYLSPQKSSTCTAVHATSDVPCWSASDFETYNSTSGVNTPVQMDFGETGPGVFRGPGYWDVDTVLSKKFYVKEKYALEFGAQAYNVLNHPNFSNPTASITSGSIGTTSSDVGPSTSPYGSGQGALVTGRVMVVMAKFSF
jgi:Carboxypeptidase regulatory-like domain